VVQANRKVAGIVARYSDVISRCGIHAEAICLFGSRARGRPDADGDIDLVVVSRAFRRMGYLRSLALLGEAAAEILEPIQAIPYTPSEFASSLPGGFFEAIRPHCVPVFPPDVRRA